ncbi:hypothetical protein ID866_8706 [Astraeus odoratus]|nr:hypothetical protein ID866_8706 [Astraeus odoratus]
MTVLLKKTSHTKDDCYEGGGGKANKHPKWFLANLKRQKKKDEKAPEKGGEKVASAATEETEPSGLIWLAQADDEDNDKLTEIAEEDVPQIRSLTVDDNDKAFTKSFNYALLAGKDLHTGKRMYLFNSVFAGLAKASKTLTMEEVHACIGHLTPEAIHCMLKDGTITAIMLDEVHTTMGTCDSCKYAKAT